MSNMDLLMKVAELDPDTQVLLQVADACNKYNLICTPESEFTKTIIIVFVIGAIVGIGMTISFIRTRKAIQDRMEMEDNV